MFEKKVKHRANDASNDGHRPPLHMMAAVLLGPRPSLWRLPTMGAGLTHRFLAGGASVPP